MPKCMVYMSAGGGMEAVHGRGALARLGEAVERMIVSDDDSDTHLLLMAAAVGGRSRGLARNTRASALMRYGVYGPVLLYYDSTRHLRVDAVHALLAARD